jgi:hypothetical protein
MASHVFCDGIRRRDFLRVGALGGFSLATYLKLVEAGQVKNAKGKSAIFINLAGGPTHMDTFDLKPDAPEEYRGEFKPIATKTPGVEIAPLLPKLAQCTDRFAILRGVSHNLAAHEFGTKYMNTGNRPLPSLEFPGYGAVVSKELGGPTDLPWFVAIPNTPQVPGYLGVQYAALNTGATPRAGQPFSVRGISLAGGVTVSEVERRQNLLEDLDRTFHGFEEKSDLLSGLDRFSQRAYDIISSKRAREAFDVSKESPSVAQRFGGHAFGQSCLLAYRLVQAGVRFVTVNFGGWDMHRDIFRNLKQRLPELDQGLAALFEVLGEKGLLGSTTVFVTGEFGRTPRINNQRAGRDHWPRAMFVLLAGSGIRGGQVLGKSDEKGQGPVGDGFTPDDVAATFYHSLGIDHEKEYETTTGRPVMIVRYGKVIKELFG